MFHQSRKNFKWLWISLFAVLFTTIPQNNAITASLYRNVQPYVLKLAQDEPTSSVRVIVQTADSPDELQNHVAGLGGKVVRSLDIIQGYLLELPAQNVLELANRSQTRWISLDAPVYASNATDGSLPNARDDFDDVNYQGSTGGYPWGNGWQEIGESDGAESGDIAVTDFWGGALQGLRIQNRGKGATRWVDLQGTDDANLSFAFRRKDFTADDKILVEVSTDGGSTWATLTSLTGPATDAEIQFATVSLQNYRSSQTQIRFVSGGSTSENARFYLDFVDIQALLPKDAPTLNANKTYLPLITGGANVTAQSKSEALNAEVVNASGACSYNCFDLTKLTSNYVKSIGADQLWNVSPYLRGDGVTVAIVDSGITRHPDLNDYNGNSRVVAQVNFAANTSTPDDYYGHGTHIAGIIGGLGTRSGGAYMGVAPEAKFVDVKVINDQGYGTTADVVAGIQWIYENRNVYNIRVANLSLNSSAPESYTESPLDAAVEILWVNKIVVVVSSGNKGSQHIYAPGNDPFVITVGASDDKDTSSLTDDTLATFSAFGLTESNFAKPEILAPGANIVSLLASDDMNLARDHAANIVTAPNGSRYFKMSGTSMAAAVTSGAVALLLEDEPALTPDQVKYRLTATARSISSAAACSTGAGILNVNAAVNSTTTSSANTGIRLSPLLSTGTSAVAWNSVNWNSVNWNSVNWNSYSGSDVWDSAVWELYLPVGASRVCSGITSFTLVDASTNRDVQPIFPGAVLDLRKIGTTNLNVRADVAGSNSGIDFDLDNGKRIVNDSVTPYSLFGDLLGIYYSGEFSMGKHTLDGTVYRLNFLTKYKGNVMDTTFRVGTSLQSEYSEKCLDVAGASKSTGATLIQYNCTSRANQVFELMPVSGRSNTYTMVSSNSGKCAEIANASTADGVNMIQNACSGNTNQQFQLRSISGKADTYQLAPVHSGKCLDIAGGSMLDLANTIQATCSTSTSQQWRLKK